jgi:RNA polymerase sigma-70 factor, ECF subfamily
VPFTAWLYRIAHNQLVDFVRTLPRHTAQSLDVVADVAEHKSGAEYRGVLDRETLEPALARLTAEQRKAVELRFLQGMSVAETSVAIGRSEEAVKKLQARGLANLRRSLVETAEPKSPARLVRAA